MRVDALAEQIEGAAAVVPTAGTTSTTSVDPVREIAALCEDAGAWLHLDAAYAGSAAVCEELRWTLDGAELADSHRRQPTQMALHADGLLVLLDSPAGSRLPCAFSAEPRIHARARRTVTDLKDYGPALGRRFRGLKLWAVLRCYGREGLQALIREHVRLAQLFASWVEEEPGWEIAAPHALSVVCFRREGSDEENAAILERVNRSGEAFLSQTRLDGRLVLRLAIGNARTTEDDVRRAWAALQEAAA